ncbi:mediator of RNA polymerase II transcription subunit 26 [Chrysoperla carnea]|uniref:mediator of RNA polymerase II transcription subunit 26 n=1 Tax=Chrysoperla carnea TaxID=189513 RepID=UPI001D095D42|nr:mediator of RNA polymerase II transcription subunit 26 [Chrysoperla carnea]
MQNTVTELSHRLLRSLDNNYNVIDMQAVVEIITALERTSITEELLKTTRLGKYINELRKKTSNEILAKRAKELLKKWRDQVIPSSQSNSNTATHQQHQHQHQNQNSMTITNITSSANGTIPTATSKTKQHQHLMAYNNTDRSSSPDLNLNRSMNHKKRPLSTISIDDSSNGRKRIKMNGRHPHHHNISSNDQIYISDNSNSSPNIKKIQHNSSLIVLNSDSNSNFSDRVPPTITDAHDALNNDTNLTFSGRNLGVNTSSSSLLNESSSSSRTSSVTPTPQQPPPTIQTATPLPPILQKPEPKKRGRKKGSKNHKTLLVQAEESFTNKMAVSVNSKVKTTQELLASIQNKTNLVRPTTTTTTPQSQSSSVQITKKVISPKILNNFGDSPKRYQNSSPKLSENKNLKTTIIDINTSSKSPSLTIQRTASPKPENKFLSKLKERSDSPIKIDLDSENSRSSYQDSVVCITREGTSDDAESEIIDLDVHEDDEDVPKTSKVLVPEDDVKVESPPGAEEETIKVDDATSTVEEILAKLPKIDYSVLYETDEDEPTCTCPVVQPVVATSNEHNITVEFHEDGTNGDDGSGNNLRGSTSCSIFDVPDENSGGGNSESRTNMIVKQTQIDKIISSKSDDEDGDEEDVDDEEVYDVSTCPAKRYLDEKYRLVDDLDKISDERVEELHTCFLDTINGNKCDKTVNQRICDDKSDVGGFFSNIVPNFHAGEIIKKDITLESINYIKYKQIIPYPLLTTSSDHVQDDTGSDNRTTTSDQQCCDESTTTNNTTTKCSNSSSSSVALGQQQQHEDDADADKHLSHDNFREFHECVSLRSYNDELLHILPYVVLD